jgi:hypothetical protein
VPGGIEGEEDMMDIEKILTGRRLIDAYLEATIKPGAKDNSGELDAAIKALGFKDHQAFYDANEEANYLEKAKCYEIEGECDDCTGRDKGCLFNCQLGYEQMVLAVAPDAPKLREGALKIKDTSDYYKAKAINGELTLRQMKRIFAFFYTWRNYPDNVPPGCSCRFRKIKEPDFDIYWGMQKGIMLAQHNTLKKRIK